MWQFLTLGLPLPFVETISKQQTVNLDPVFGKQYRGPELIVDHVSFVFERIMEELEYMSCAIKG
jgi:hypothetical protein